MLVVQKYGGTSVGTVERIRERGQALPRDAAGRGTTSSSSSRRWPARPTACSSWPDEVDDDPLPERARARRHRRDRRAGHGRRWWRSPSSAAGGKAQSFLGHQVRILTDSAFASARIQVDRRARRSARRSTAGKIAVVAGFQGVDEDGNITTLGRGGSDTTARGDRRGAQGRRLRDLHRRRRRLHHRPEHRAPTRARSTASATRRCSSWRRSAPRCCRSARSSSA